MSTQLIPGTTAVPEPSGALPFFGHALQIPNGFAGLRWMMRQAVELGPLYRLRILDTSLLLASGLEVVSELSDPDRFRKNLHPDLVLLRGLGGDGLFTAFNDEPNWRKAHDILMPAFSLGAMRGYHETMLRVARNLIASWDRRVGRAPVDVAGDMTKLTFDTIGLCGFGYDFDSFGRTEPHPFISALSRALAFAQLKGASLPGMDLLQWRKAEEFVRDVASMKALVDEVIQKRRASGDRSVADLLGRMLHTPDAVTGTPLDDQNIRNQAITFLIAGHETTSGALSFALYFLTKHPEVLARAQAETDALWGDVDDPAPTYADMGKLTYIRQILSESLRLWPTAPAFAVEASEDTTIGAGRYSLRAGETVMVLTPQLHRDPAWGVNVELFDPDRFTPDREASRPQHLFKPFGNGDRACIGRQFALHEATLVLALLVHRYRFVDHADYQLAVAQSLTIKPDGFTLGLARRTGADRQAIGARFAGVGLAGSAQAAADPAGAADRPGPDGGTTDPRTATGTALRVLHGSNLGTCAGIARDLADGGGERGFATAVASLDSAIETLTPDGGPVVIVAASYNGRPTDDATAFMAWLDRLEPHSLKGMRYAVLGAGDRNWAATYQRIPTLIDARLADAGATRLTERGEADASGDFAGAVERWTADLWAALLDEYGSAADPSAVRVQVDPAIVAAPREPLYRIDDARDGVLGELVARHGLMPMEVLRTRELVDLSHPLGRSKRFLRLRLPEGVTYRTADHLAVLPKNPPALVRRVADRFGLDLDRTVRLTVTRPSREALPVDRPLTLRRLLTEFVELQQPAAQAAVAVLAERTACPPEKRPLAELAHAAAESFHTDVTAVGLSLLDLLERYPACELPFERFLELLPALKPRHYSISSSSSANPTEIDLMVSLLAAPHRSGSGSFHGIGSHYLQDVAVGDVVQARVLPCRDGFRLPADAGVPVIMVSAGTGVAPFRGAVLDRMQAGTGGPLLCYFGCDHPDVDYLHREDFEAAQAAGVVSMRPTFMHAPTEGVRFVQDRITAEADEVWELLQAGGRVYVCGDGRLMAPAVRAAFQAIHRDRTGVDAAQSADWLAELVAADRYVEDVWAG